MRSKQISQLSAILLSACLGSMAHHAAAQEPTPAPAAVETPVAVESRSAESFPQVGTVPTYQLTDYELTPASSGTEARSEIRRWPNRPLLVTSTLVLAASYLPAMIMAAVNDDDTTDNLYIPVAGPWLELAREPASPGNKALLVISGVFQDLGALGLVTSLFVPERRTSRWYLIGNQRFSAAPVADRYTYGVTARGRF